MRTELKKADTDSAASYDTRPGTKWIYSTAPRDPTNHHHHHTLYSEKSLSRNSNFHFTQH